MLRPRLTSILALVTLATTSWAAQDLPPRPIGWLDKLHTTYTEQDDFMLIGGPLRRNTFVHKLFFTSKIRAFANGAEQRALFAQPLEKPNVFQEYFVGFGDAGASSAPIKLGVFVLTAGNKIQDFVRTTDTFGDSPRNAIHYNRIFFRVPGRGYYSSEGGLPPLLIRAENTNPLNQIIAGTIFNSDYRFDNLDRTAQARLFLTARDVRKGRKVFISAGTSRTTTLLPELTAGGAGTDPDQYTTLAPETVEPHSFYVAKATDGTSQLFRVFNQDVNGTTRFTGGAFTTGGAGQPQGKPENLVANSYELFFTAPAVAGGTPELWHLASGFNSVSDLEVVSTGGLDPQDLTFNDKERSYSYLAMTVNDNGARRYTTYNNFAGVVSILDRADGDPLPSSNPYEITDTGSYFYFAATYDDGNGITYLNRHSTADNSVETITYNGGFPANIGEVEAVSLGANSGTLYFTAAATVDGVAYPNVLFKMVGNDPSTEATPCRTLTGKVVTGAHNLRAIADNGTPGIYRLYFTAEVSRTVNSDFFPANIPASIQTLGTKPWTTEVP